MSFRIFKRTVWQTNPDWPNGFEPLATPMDKCQTLKTVHTEGEARQYCQEQNDKRPYRNRNVGDLTQHQRKSKMLAPYCEYTEL